jgi:hypothetical protein
MENVRTPAVVLDAHRLTLIAATAKVVASVLTWAAKEQPLPP